MTNKEKKAWLRRAADANELISDMRQSYKEVFEMATSITASYSGMASSGSRHPHKFEKVAEYRERVEQAVNEMAEKRTEVLEAIKTIDDIQQRRVMMKRYVDGKKWDDIAEEMNYSIRAVTYMHGKALESIRIPE